MSDFPLGITLSFIGALSTSVGICLQTQIKNQLYSKPKLDPKYKRTEYMIAIILVFVGMGCKIINFGILPLSTMAALSSLTVIFTKLSEVYFLDEEISYKLFLCMLLIFIGNIIIIKFSDLTEENYSLNQIITLFLHENCITFTISISTIIILLTITLNYIQISYQSKTGLLFICTVCAILSAWTSVISKAIVEVVLHAIFNDTTEFFSMTMFIFFGILMLLLKLKSRVIQFGLFRFHSVLFLPTYQVPQTLYF